ncbi:PREDICTED: NAC domain-containing protein 78-like isoform X2 [Brassica oleracea var. oleracea]|uniref:NAC domain-containing protein 78-like isoform X2 n=1 Tax=Brassica oleracea var. oleracea TaxID=109376 RepID=UPI0006A7473C|nr:PREDICTED: NAC domain-containing protein 78-like isoform X2 [Brassica oleracea var. oleracea]
MGRGSATSLAPGFRFHPTDEELVRYYLKRKVCNKPFNFDAISVADVYKSEPWDLPDKSKLKGRDLEWYFFSMLDKKYSNGSKTNRATERGYWKTTGKDREIRNGTRAVGMKKTLVYHKGRAPRGERSNWVMHEYRLTDDELKIAGAPQDAFVLCRVFQKCGTGDKYGAPCLEEEWEEDTMTFVPEQEALCEGFGVDGDDVYLDIDEKPEDLVVCDAIPVQTNYCHGESSNNVESGNYEDCGNYVVDSEQPIEEEELKPIIRDGGIQPCSLFPGEQIGCGVEDEKAVNLETSNDNVFVAADTCYSGIPVDDANYMPEEPFINHSNNLSLSDGLSGAPLQDDFNFEDYLNFFDDEDAQNLSLDVSQLLGSGEGLDQKPSPEELEKEKKSGEGSSSKQDADVIDLDSASKHPFLKKGSHMFAPPSFASSQFQTKDAAIRLHAAQSSGSVHVTAGMMRISNMTTLAAESSMGWSYDKNGNLNVVLSLGLVQSKTGRITATRAMLIFMCFWILLLYVSFKIGTIVSAR